MFAIALWLYVIGLLLALAIVVVGIIVLTGYFVVGGTLDIIRFVRKQR